LAIDRLRTHALYLLGRVYVLKKENEKAVPYLEQALQLEPDLPEANSLLGTAYLRLGRVENAVAKLEKAAPSDHYGNVHYQLAVAYRKLGQTDRAKKELLLWRDVRRNSAEREEALVMRSAPPPVIDGLDAK
jgi:tetratricopeptide (TPR) repeat protein